MEWLYIWVVVMRSGSGNQERVCHFRIWFTALCSLEQKHQVCVPSYLKVLKSCLLKENFLHFLVLRADLWRERGLLNSSSQLCWFKHESICTACMSSAPLTSCNTGLYEQLHSVVLLFLYKNLLLSENFTFASCVVFTNQCSPEHSYF